MASQSQSLADTKHLSASENAPQIHPKYRADIDGLRAIAVVAVLVFHAFPDVLRGGFVGVDVFFVISGFLISTIILQNLEQNRFKFSDFYVRRIRRIFPALSLVLASCFAFAWFTLFGDEFKLLGKHLMGGVGFVSNLVYWNEAGYFDTAADTKPLLHLWSLGVEEQFYILWPVLLWLGWKLKRNLFHVVCLVALLSFVGNLVGVQGHPVATFYSPLSRFWELLGGGILAYQNLHKPKWLRDLTQESATKILSAGQLGAHSTRIRDTISILGLLMIVVACCLLDKTFLFPGYWALLPVLGAMGLIVAGPGAWANRVILSSRPMVAIGLVSYPLYLWHYPLLVFPRVLLGETPIWQVRLAALLMALLLAIFTYAIIERPLRFSRYKRASVSVLLVFMGLIGLIGFNTYERDGLKFRNVARINPVLDGSAGGGYGEFIVDECGLSPEQQTLFGNCKRDTRESPRFAVLGDSKAAALAPGLFRTSQAGGRWIFIGGTKDNTSPVPVISNSPSYEAFQTPLAVALQAIESQKSIRTLVLVTATRSLFRLGSLTNLDELASSGNFDEAFHGLNAVVERMLAAGKDVVLVVDNPTLPFPEDCMNRKTPFASLNPYLSRHDPKCFLALSKHMALSAPYARLLEKVRAQHPQQVRIFNTLPIMCDMKQQMCQHYKDGHMMYSYSDHISDFAAGLIGVELNRFLGEQDSQK